MRPRFARLGIGPPSVGSPPTASTSSHGTGRASESLGRGWPGSTAETLAACTGLPGGRLSGLLGPPTRTTSKALRRPLRSTPPWRPLPGHVTHSLLHEDVLQVERFHF